MFARVDTTFLPIHRESDWPEQFDAAVVVVRDSAGTLRAIEIQPRSESGDWSLRQRHEFDANGRTVRYESVGRFFGACEGVTEASLTIEFDSTFARREELRTLRDRDGAARDPEECGHSYEFFDGQPRRSLVDLQRARQVPATFD